MQLYPLKFTTIFKDKIWGGHKIKNILGKDSAPLPNCGETWEISGIESDISIVAEGPLKGERLDQLIEKYQSNLVGDTVYKKFGNQFPLLIKFIDANDDLSIQVHPNDELSKKRHNSFGKTEMWYIIQADPGAKLISGFNKKIDRDTYLEHFEQNRLDEILNQEEVFADDIFHIPAGRVHTIGKGILLAEIQQTSDITYRIYDFDRTDDKGNKRQLHTQEAIDAIDYNYYNEYKTVVPCTLNETTSLVQDAYFTTNRLYLDQTKNRNYHNLDSFVILICIDGESEITTQNKTFKLKKGECMLIPASIKEIQIKPEGKAKILETYC